MSDLTKTEYTTSLIGNEYVRKDHPRIIFRGKLDTLLALVDLIKSQGVQHPKLGIVKGVLNIIMVAEIIGVPISILDSEIEVSLNESQQESHDIGIIDNDKTYGTSYNWLNYLRTQIRECEIAAVQAFTDGEECTRVDIVQGMNRLSSLVHTMMYDEIE